MSKEWHRVHTESKSKLPGPQILYHERNELEVFWIRTKDKQVLVIKSDSGLPPSVYERIGYGCPFSDCELLIPGNLSVWVAACEFFTHNSTEHQDVFENKMTTLWKLKKSKII